MTDPAVIMAYGAVAVGVIGALTAAYTAYQTNKRVKAVAIKVEADNDAAVLDRAEKKDSIKEIHEVVNSKHQEALDKIDKNNSTIMDLQKTIVVLTEALTKNGKVTKADLAQITSPDENPGT